jgi:glycosyltransferase involved in cell wall biosynthesis
LIFETVDVWPDVPEQMKILKNQWILKYLHTKVEQIYQHAHKIIALSPDMKKQIMNHQVPEEKIIVSYNGTNIETFYPLPKDNATPKVIYAGSVGKVNDLSYFVKAAKALEDKAQFILLGNGNEASTIQKLVHKLHPKNFYWHTWVAKNKVHPYMASCDIGVSTIAHFKVLEANSANKFYDYLACGLPIVNNYEGWQKDFLIENHCGFGSRLGNLKEFIDYLAYLIESPFLRKSMSIHARNAAVKNFDRKKLALDLLNSFS